MQLKTQLVGSDKRNNDGVDYTAPEAFAQTVGQHIGHRECEMLLQNMADVGYPKDDIQKTYAAAYGFTVDDSAWDNKSVTKAGRTKLEALSGQWDEAKFDKYKQGALFERMTNPQKNYTFVLAKNEQGETIGLASFNAPEDKSQLRVLNFTVHRDHRGESAQIITALSREIMKYAMERGFKDAPINAPVSNYAIAKGNNAAYQRLAERYGVPHQEKPDGPDQNLLSFTPTPLEEMAVRDVSHGERINQRRARAASAAERG